MPKLQRLGLYFKVWKREGGGIDVGLENLASLKHVTVEVDCEIARLSEVEDVENKIKDAIGMHPNRPTLQLSREGEYLMARTNEDNPEASDQKGGDLLSADDESENESDVSE
ncbi:hypothetical protein ACP70R_003668 [Stipagrostis hirtigluma subsp. patula]